MLSAPPRIAKKWALAIVTWPSVRKRRCASVAPVQTGEAITAERSPRW